MPARPTPRLASRRGAGALAAVIALHLALWAMVRGTTHPVVAGAATVARVSVRMVQAPRPIVEPTRAETPERATVPPRRAAGGPGASTGGTVDEAAARAAITPPAGATPAAEPNTPARPERPLDLALPRGFADRPGTRNPALDDPRSNTARLGAAERFAAALGSADTAIVEEPLGDGRRRIRQGGACVIATPARVSQLFPFDDAAQRAPQKIEPC